MLKAATANMEKPEKPPPTFTQETPTTASAIVKYLWNEAYPNGADPTEALRLFSPAIRYEDFNYASPFLGLEQVTAFVTAFDIPGVDFVPLKVSEGERACAFTWIVKVNGLGGSARVLLDTLQHNMLLRLELIRPHAVDTAALTSPE